MLGNVKTKLGLLLVAVVSVAVVGVACGGSDITQADYDALQARVDSLDNQLTQTNSTLSSTQAMVTMLNESVAGLQADLEQQNMVSDFVPSRPVYSAGGLVSAANPIAARAGLEILEAGGSAIDAAIAIQLVLTVVEPQSSGIGGGAFLLHWDDEADELTTYDGRETAPSAATEEYFFQSGEAIGWWDARIGGRSVGVPGVLRMLEAAHDDHGTLPWARLFDTAIAVAEDGFAVSPRLNASITSQIDANEMRGLNNTSDIARDYFYDNGTARAVGSTLQNQPLADTFRAIAEGGADAFYTGDIAQGIVSTVNAENLGVLQGILSLDDLADYEAVRREPVCYDYREYRICGMAPPTSGGLTVLQILGILENFDLGDDPFDPSVVHLYTQAARLAYADRGRYIGDSDFVDVPIEGLLDEDYLRARSTLIDRNMDGGNAEAGSPPGASTAFVDGISTELPSTTHFSVVDRNGNAVSSTSSVESSFGSYLMSGGFILNNQLTDFSRTPRNADGSLIANSVAANKRPRSSMSPMMVFDSDGDLRLVIGSPGGSRIINYVAQTIIAVLDWDMDIQSAISLPHYANRNGATDLEEGTVAATLQDELMERGHMVNVRALTSGLHGIEVTDEGLFGGADPRREGIALGE